MPETVFQELLREGAEVGFQLCVIQHRRELMHFAGGKIGPQGGAVTGETLFPVFSVTKGLTAILVHQCIDRGWLNVDEPVATYWPEFAAQGKGGITLREVLHHTAGIPEFPPEATVGDVLDWEGMARKIAALKPGPYGRFQYHAWTFGWPVRIVLERATGKPFQTLLNELLIEPLQLTGSLYVGCPDEAISRVANIIEPDVVEADWRRPFGEVAVMKIGSRRFGYYFNFAPVLKAVIPASTGVSTARALAVGYAALFPGGPLVSKAQWEAILRWETCATVEGAEERCSLGFRWRKVEIGGRQYDAFGHSGYGGSIGLAIPELGVAVGYTRNSFCAQPSLPRLLNAVLG